MDTTRKIDTSRVAERRKLRFADSRELLAEAEGILAAERAGRLRALGNWTPGQAFGHLATWIGFCFDGYPPSLRAPWWLRMLTRMARRKFIHGGLSSGLHIPKVDGGTFGREPLPSAEGLVRLRREWERLDAAAPTLVNPLFGPMTHEEWKQLHFRHAELHLGFFRMD